MNYKIKFKGLDERQEPEWARKIVEYYKKTHSNISSLRSMDLGGNNNWIVSIIYYNSEADDWESILVKEYSNNITKKNGADEPIKFTDDELRLFDLSGFTLTHGEKIKQEVEDWF